MVAPMVTPMVTRRGFATAGLAAFAGRMLPEMAYAQRAAVWGKLPPDTVFLNANENPDGPPRSSIEAMASRMRTAIRVRSRGSLGVMAKVGDSKLTEQQLAENILSAITAIVKKLPNGDRNIKTVMVKTTMGKPAKQAVD